MHCPRCGAQSVSAAYDITWVEAKKQFYVKATIVCRYGCPSSTEVSRIPVKIARESRCTCGSKMTLSDHRVRSTNGDIELEAIYKCKKCEKEDKTLVKNLKRGLCEVWRRTKSVEVGPSGVRYEKEATPVSTTGMVSSLDHLVRTHTMPKRRSKLRRSHH